MIPITAGKAIMAACLTIRQVDIIGTKKKAGSYINGNRHVLGQQDDEKLVTKAQKPDVKHKIASEATKFFGKIERRACMMIRYPQTRQRAISK